LKILLGGSNIDWDLKGSAEAVSVILGVCMFHYIYKYGNEPVEFVARRRKGGVMLLTIKIGGQRLLTS
jgi:hypothetical protein